MRFPYTRIDPLLPARPYINFFLRSNFATTDTLFGLVDSGADYPIFSVDFATTLKLNLGDGVPWSFRGTTGQLQVAYIHKVEMSVWDPDNKFIAFRFETTVSFCDDFKFPGGSLLGQYGFLSHFKTTFQQSDNFFDLEPSNPDIQVKPISTQV